MGRATSLKIATLLFLSLVSLAKGLPKGRSSGNHSDVIILNSSEEYKADEVVGKSPVDLVKLRGFEAERHFVVTKDGYHIHVVRIINPLIKSKVLKRPVVFNHGLLESSTIWLINSLGVKPQPYENDCKLAADLNSTSVTSFRNGPFMLANNGYDVWLMSMRGTDWSLKHSRLSPKDDEFWNYCLDDFALVDVPTVIDYVRLKTKSTKVAYVGHSQATFSVFGLLSTRPVYAEVIEPVIAVAPVAFFDHITSLARVLFLSTLRATDRDKHGPFPSSAKRARALLSQYCAKDPKSIASLLCQFSEILIGGIGKPWPVGYFSQLPYFTSLKILRHFGQLIKNRRFMMYDYGEKGNKKIYGQSQSPSYPIENITSKSICLIRTERDALSPPKDVDRFKEKLTVPLFKDILVEGAFNHFDMITDESAYKLVFKHILDIVEQFEFKSGNCVREQPEKTLEEPNSHYEIEKDLKDNDNYLKDTLDEKLNHEALELQNFETIDKLDL